MPAPAQERLGGEQSGLEAECRGMQGCPMPFPCCWHSHTGKQYGSAQQQCRNGAVEEHWQYV